MKFSAFKYHILKQFGERGWKELENMYGYSLYFANEEEQLKAVKDNKVNLYYINNPSEKIQLETLKNSSNYIDNNLCNPSEKVLLQFMREAEDIDDMVLLLKYIEKD